MPARTSEVQASPVSRTQATSARTSVAESPVAPSPSQDRRSARKSEKGALFLKSTKKQLESRRTIQALRRIQLVSAGITDFRDGDDAPTEELSTEATSLAGVDTSWGATPTAGPSYTSWDAPALAASDVATGWGDQSTDPQGIGAAISSNTGWGDDAPAAPFGSTGWGDEPASTDQPSASAINAGWGSETATATGMSSASTVRAGWGDEATSASAAAHSTARSEPVRNEAPLAAGVKTHWGTNRPDNTAVSTAWDSPADSVSTAPQADTARGRDETSSATNVVDTATTAGVSLAWDAGPEDTTASVADVSSGWGAVPATSAANTGWNTGPSGGVGRNTWFESSTTTTRPSSGHNADRSHMHNDPIPSSFPKQYSDDGWGSTSGEYRGSGPATRTSHADPTTEPSISRGSRAQHAESNDSWSATAHISSSTGAQGGWGEPGYSSRNNTGDWGSRQSDREQRQV